MSAELFFLFAASFAGIFEFLRCRQFVQFLSDNFFLLSFFYEE